MEKINLDRIVESVRTYVGLVRKSPIKDVVEKLHSTHKYGEALPNFGDDAAVIPFKDEYLLLATDGMMTGLIINEPYAAGKASVMVTVNDIYSMGGRPIGMVNVLASGDEKQRALIVDGIERGCHKLQVPMLGGHLHPDPEIEIPSLSVAILGVAKKPLRSHQAMEGDDLILAVDLNGSRGCRSVISWDANSGKTAEELLYRLEVLPLIAELELSCAAKDISNAGILGTVSIFLENSGKGGNINLDTIPRPESIDLKDWLHCFQSFGFILAVNPENSRSVLELFSSRDIDAAIIGTVARKDRVVLNHGTTSRVLFDFKTDKITGIRYKGSNEQKSLEKD
ncbi:MAG: methanogenesis marker 2 protein [Deltaproteobacteria bacterium]|nr:methanogenesis marker 2 protein [Deltaproteobacteria bacterium]